MKPKYTVNNNYAVNEVIGGLMLLCVAVLAFSVIYLNVFSTPLPPPEPNIDLCGYVDENGLVVLEHMGGMTQAMDAIMDVLNLMKGSETVAETMGLVLVAKLLCYEKGVPKIMSEGDIVKGAPTMPKEMVLDMLGRLESGGLLLKKEEEGVTTYQLTKKADELGEAIFPLFVWALKWGFE